jgi:hypothetical protein
MAEAMGSPSADLAEGTKTEKLHIGKLNLRSR